VHEIIMAARDNHTDKDERRDDVSDVAQQSLTGHAAPLAGSVRGDHVSPEESAVAHFDHPSPDDDEVFDLANLSEAHTGVPGFILISTRFPQHGPRVKLGADQPNFSVTVAEEPEVVVNSLPDSVVKRMSPTVIEWVRLNREALLSFWNEGAYWPKEQVDVHLNAFARLP
jgi:hypothetical protein